MTYWQSERAGTTSFEGCPDSFVDEVGGRMDLGAGQFVTYRVEDGGETATEMDCTTTDGATCRANDEVVFEVDDHRLDTLIEETTLLSGSCILNVDTEIELVDQGDQAHFTNALATSYAGDACDDVDAEVVAASENGHGFGDCVVTVEGTLQFVAAD